jgi:hypothetical protein
METHADQIGQRLKRLTNWNEPESIGQGNIIVIDANVHYLPSNRKLLPCRSSMVNKQCIDLDCYAPDVA